MKLLPPLLLSIHLLLSGTAMAKGWLETPFTAAQIHAACPEGARMSLLFTDVEGKRTIRDSFFHAGTDKLVWVQSTTRDDAGGIVDPTTDVRHTWVELQRHARFRDADATRTRAEFNSRLGHFVGWRYEVSEVGPDGSPMRTLMWFADAVPGPPLRMEVRSGLVVVMTMDMLSRDPMPTP